MIFGAMKIKLVFNNLNFLLGSKLNFLNDPIINLSILYNVENNL